VPPPPSVRWLEVPADKDYAAAQRLREYLVIADGYHRVSAAFHVDEETPVPGRLLWMP
jgi:hypothetical protein